MNGTGMMVYWDENGQIVGTIDFQVEFDDDDNVLGVVDFYGAEEQGLTIPGPSNAVDGGHWPEWLGGGALDFKVELGEGPHRVKALIHTGHPAGETSPAVPGTGYRRERAAVEAAVAQRIAEAKEAAGEGQPWTADIRDIIGTPTRELRVGNDGQNYVPKPRPERARLPVIPRDRPFR